MDVLKALEQWYKDQCDGDWEHSYGVDIKTVDDLGWSVTIDLEDTDLENATLERNLLSATEGDFYACWIEGGKFRGTGGPNKLRAILAKFDELRQQTRASD